MKRIKFYSLTLIFLVYSKALYAGPLHIRPELGLNLAKMRVESNNYWGTRELNTQFKPGIRAGVNFKVYIRSGLFIEPGAFYAMKGFKKNDMTANTQTLPVVFTKVDLTHSTNYFEIPVNLGYDLALKEGGSIVVAAGPYVGFLASGKIKQEFEHDVFEDVNEPMKIGSDKLNDDIKSLDFGLNISLGYLTPQGVYFRAQGGLGAANLMPDDEIGNMKNFTLSFSVGYDLPVGGSKEK